MRQRNHRQLILLTLTSGIVSDTILQHTWASDTCFYIFIHTIIYKTNLENFSHNLLFYLLIVTISFIIFDFWNAYLYPNELLLQSTIKRLILTLPLSLLLFFISSRIFSFWESPLRAKKSS